MKKKHKILKTFGFTSLALLMGAAGVFAFAPLCAGAQGGALASASEMVETTTEQGLITPKADDPVIYTTESGLEIKVGNAVNPGQLSSGNLTNFAYFNTTDGSTTYTWVIIGKNPNLKVGGIDSSRLFSTWQSMDSKFTTDWKYFRDNIYENITPAGSAINAVTPSKGYVADLTSNSEIPSGCVLVLANNTISNGAYNNTYRNPRPEAYHHFPPSYIATENIVTTMNNYYTQKTLGLDSIISNIQKISSLTTYTYYWYDDYHFITDQLQNVYIYPLGCNTQSSFYYANYLTAAQIKLSQNQWLRGNHYGTLVYTQPSSNYCYFVASVINTSGTLTYVYNHDTSVGYRPAFCLKLT